MRKQPLTPNSQQTVTVTVTMMLLVEGWKVLQYAFIYIFSVFITNL